MESRVNACLDGDLPPSALEPSERAAVEAIRAVAAAARAEAPAPAVDLGPLVLRRIRDLGLDARPTPAPAPVPAPATGLRSVLDSLWRPRRVAFGLRPAWGLGAAALVAGILLATGSGSTNLERGPELAQAPPVYVQFRIEAVGAGNVSLAGSFSEWEPRHEMVETQPGVWTLIIPLEPGVHDYAFLVDGERWMADPAAPMIDDGFGGTNSRLSLLPASEGTI
ncbi:MAG TPA: glycogen-binding domain-containing protein [Longimicrobiales bacterium]|nr:glycogen-binding domain-containing protein [Longimicrobiales bacterium]